jgi:glycine/D-amino acid oxidase-like deaminating enzyme
VSDVLVIGGGVIGCGIAHALTTRGADVTVIDPRSVGDGASRASAGMLAPFSEGRHDPACRSGRPEPRAIRRSPAVRWSRGTERSLYARPDRFDVALDDPRARGSSPTRAAVLIARDGIVCELLDRTSVARTPSPAVPTAVAWA